MSHPVLYLALVLSLVPVVWLASQYARHRTEARAALAHFHTISTQAVELANLKAAAPPEARRPRPDPGIASRLAHAVALANLPQTALQNITPELESTVSSAQGAPAYRRTTVRLTLEPITLPELGRFLSEWRTAEPTWTVTTIDLTPVNRPVRDQQRPLRAALVIETIFASADQDLLPINPQGKH
jgi:hypothetical protein